MENHFYHIRWAPLSVTIFIMHVRILCYGSYANEQYGPKSGCPIRVYRIWFWFDSLLPINNFSVIKRQIFLGWTSTKLRLMFLLKDTTLWRRWDLSPPPLGLESSTLPLSHCAPFHSVCLCSKSFLEYIGIHAADVVSRQHFHDRKILAG